MTNRRPRYSIPIGLRSRLCRGQQFLFFVNHSVTDLVVWFCSLSYCIFPSMIASCPGPEAAKQPRAAMLSAPSDSPLGWGFFCSPAVHFFPPAKHSSSRISFVHRTLFQKPRGTLKWSFAKLRRTAMCFCEKNVTGHYFYLLHHF